MGRVATVVWLSASLLIAQGQEPPTFRTGAREVLVDAIVRDDRGKPMRGLTAADFTLHEDGVAQQILAVREVSGGVVVTTTAPRSSDDGAKVSPAASPGQLKQVHLVSLVFERLGPESRRLAKQAGLDLLKDELPSNTYYAVFVIQNTLGLVQNFTSDRELLRRAVLRVTEGNRIELGPSGTLESVVAGAAQGASAPGDGNAAVAAQVNRIATNMVDFTGTLARQQQGNSSLYSVLAIANEQRRVPGRKTVLYFSEGLVLTNDHEHILQAVKNAANRGNVSIYAIDARGLSTQNDAAAGQELLTRAASANRAGLYNSASTNSDQASALQRDGMFAADAGLDALRANGQQALRDIAESTGGVLVSNTNDLRPRVRRIAEEIATYYEIVYRPADVRGDGQWRTLSVEVKRQPAKVQHRDGYFAFPAWAAHALYPFEIPLLKALQQRPQPREVRYRAAAMRFRPGISETEVALVVEAPLQDVGFEKAGDGFRSHLSAVALLTRSDGEVAAKLARDVPVIVPEEKLNAFQAGEFIWTERTTVPSGRYTLESALADQESDRVGALRSVYLVPESREGIHLSSLCFVRRVDPGQATDLRDPFQVSNGRVIPHLTDTLQRKPGGQMPVYFTIYPMRLADANAQPELIIELRRDATLVARTSPSLPQPLEDGSIRYIAAVPFDRLEPGLYQIRIVAVQAGTSAEESLFVTIE